MAIARIAPSADTIAHFMPDGATLLVNLASSQIYEMSEPGSRLWVWLTQGQSVEQAAQKMLEEFEVSPERLAEETAELLRRLTAEGLAVPVEAR